MARKLTTDEYIKRAIEVHGGKYDYSKVDYQTNNTKVTIICKKHGEFTQRANDHLSGRGCKKCANDRLSYSTEEFIKKVKEVHGGKYDYSKVDYQTNNTKVTIICKKHGEFTQRAIDHLSNKGCPKCAGNYRPSTEEFIKKVKEVHGNKYDYSKVDYKTCRTKITIICKKHGEFRQWAGNHSDGQGCPKCANIIKASIHKDATHFYIWQEEGSNRYKIGITSKGIETRMTAVANKLNITPIPILELEIEDAFTLEQSLLQIFAEDVYEGEGYGVEFLELDDDKFRLLLSLVDQVSKNGLPAHLLRHVQDVA